MALETLKGVNEIDGFKVIRKKPEGMSWDDYDKLRDEFPINITDRVNCISFKIQDGPIKEHGVNGCQVDTLVATSLRMVEELNKKFPGPHNNNAVRFLRKSLTALKERKKDRERRGV